MTFSKKYLLYFPLDINFESQKFLNAHIIWLTGSTGWITKEIFLSREEVLKWQHRILKLDGKMPYLEYYLGIKNRLGQSHSQKSGNLKIKMRQNLIGLTLKYKKTLNVYGGGYKFALNNNALVFELGYSHKISLAWPSQIKSLRLSRRENTLQVKSYDVGLLMSLLAKLKKLRPLNPYTRKGIKYKNEIFKYKQIKRKKFL